VSLLIIPQVPMHLEMQFIDTSRCEPVELVAEIWACNLTGIYCGADPAVWAGEADLNSIFLRGAQLTDRDGVVEFDTIFPGIILVAQRMSTLSLTSVPPFSQTPLSRAVPSTTSDSYLMRVCVRKSKRLIPTTPIRLLSQGMATTCGRLLHQAQNMILSLSM